MSLELSHLVYVRHEAHQIHFLTKVPKKHLHKIHYFCNHKGDEYEKEICEWPKNVSSDKRLPHLFFQLMELCREKGKVLSP